MERPFVRLMRVNALASIVGSMILPVLLCWTSDGQPDYGVIFGLAWTVCGGVGLYLTLVFWLLGWLQGRGTR